MENDAHRYENVIVQQASPLRYFAIMQMLVGIFVFAFSPKLSFLSAFGFGLSAWSMMIFLSVRLIQRLLLRQNLNSKPKNSTGISFFALICGKILFGFVFVGYGVLKVGLNPIGVVGGCLSALFLFCIAGYWAVFRPNKRDKKRFLPNKN